MNKILNADCAPTWVDAAPLPQSPTVSMCLLTTLAPNTVMVTTNYSQSLSVLNAKSSVTSVLKNTSWISKTVKLTVLIAVKLKSVNSSLVMFDYYLNILLFILFSIYGTLNKYFLQLKIHKKCWLLLKSKNISYLNKN